MEAAGKSSDSTYFWFNQVMAAPNRNERRRVLAEVPEHLRELVEYTVRDYFDRMKARGKP